MTTRRAMLAALATTPFVLGSCSFCYSSSELVGVYRAHGTAISETVMLKADGTYWHEWRVGERHEANWSTWQDECSITLNNYLRPGASLAEDVLFFAGPPTLWIAGRPTFFSHDLDIKYVWSREADG